MKIGLKAKDYNNIIFFEIPEDDNKQMMLNLIMSTVNSGGEDKLDLVVNVKSSVTDSE